MGCIVYKERLYNAEKTLHRCVDSILAQTFTDFELLLVDDGSTDGSGKICDEYAAKDARIRAFHKENGGVSSARNLGLDNATGEWITFIDADDWIDVTMLERLSSRLNVNDVDIILCDLVMEYGNVSEQFQNVTNIHRDLLFGFNTCCAMLVRMKMLSLHDLRFANIRYFEDALFRVKCFYFASRIVRIDMGLYHYDRGNEKSSLHNMPSDSHRDMIYAEVELIKFFKEEGIFDSFRDVMYWRILRDKKELVLRPVKHQEFCSIYPESHNYIWSCPFFGKKIKCMMWLLTHKLSLVVRFFCFLRKMLRR